MFIIEPEKMAALPEVKELQYPEMEVGQESMSSQSEESGQLKQGILEY